MWHWHGDWNSGDWLSMSVMVLLVWLPLLLLIAFALRSLIALAPGTGAHSLSRGRSQARLSTARYRPGAVPAGDA